MADDHGHEHDHDHNHDHGHEDSGKKGAEPKFNLNKDDQALSDSYKKSDEKNHDIAELFGYVATLYNGLSGIEEKDEKYMADAAKKIGVFRGLYNKVKGRVGFWDRVFGRNPVYKMFRKMGYYLKDAERKVKDALYEREYGLREFRKLAVKDMKPQYIAAAA
jgi:hypothetical protein